MFYKCGEKYTQDEIIAMIAENNPNVTEVDFSSAGIAGAYTRKLTDAIRNNTHLTSLDLRGSGLVDDSWNLFLEAINDNETLKKLNIEGVASLSAESTKNTVDLCEKKDIQLEYTQTKKSLKR